KVDVIVAVTLPAALAAQRATKTIPIIFVLVPDPVATKLVASLARPGGNITGLSQLALDLLPKRLELFKETVTSLSRIALLLNPSDPIVTARSIEQVRAAAGRLDISIQPIEAGKPNCPRGRLAFLRSGQRGYFWSFGLLCGPYPAGC